MSQAAVQVFLREVVRDRPGATGAAYVVTLARGSTAGRAQVWLSWPSFSLAKWQPKGPTVQPGYVWDGAGRLVYSAPLDRLDALELQVLLIKDRSRSRRTGDVLASLFGGGAEARKVVEGLGAVAAAAEVPLQGLQVAGAVLEVTGEVLAKIGQALRSEPDRVLMDASGTLLRADLLRGRETISDAVAREGMDWGRRSSGDAGYFHLGVHTSELRDAAAFHPMSLPPEVEARLSRRDG